jgi:hypothetical protein
LIKKKQLIAIFTSIILNFTTYGKEQFLDRLLLQIDKQYFTQWEVEVHIFIKRIIYKNKKNKNPITTKDTWEDNIKEFIQDTLDLEKLKTKGLELSEIEIIRKDRLENIFYKTLQNNPKLKKRSRQLKINNIILYKNIKKINFLTQWSKLLENKKKDLNNFYTQTLENMKNAAKIVIYEKQYQKIRDL